MYGKIRSCLGCLKGTNAKISSMCVDSQTRRCDCSIAMIETAKIARCSDSILRDVCISRTVERECHETNAMNQRGHYSVQLQADVIESTSSNSQRENAIWKFRRRIRRQARGEPRGQLLDEILAQREIQS